MTVKLLFTIVAILFIQNSYSSIIAVVDSGNDFLHNDLKAKAWTNPLEIPSNDRDEDKNGYPDDVHGWNFAESNSQLIDYKYSYSYSDDAKKFFDVQLKSFLGTITQADRDWIKEKIKDEDFIKNLQIFGNWMHGTHVTGIATKNSPDSKMIGIKLIPTEVKLPGKKIHNQLILRTGNVSSVFNLSADKGLKETMIKAAVVALAKQQFTVFTEIGSYMNNNKADVMNGSFGTSYEAIKGALTQIYKSIFKKDPTEDEMKGYVDTYFAAALEEGKKFLASAPNTLFVFAAGNDGSNNDVFPTTPTNISGDNKISVAASLMDQGLANFSNYGVTTVDVAAPGVGIESTIPENHYMKVSGTSQASPYVANIAGMVKDANMKLSPREMKEIILSTVDVRPWLIGKVKTSGIVNRDRAIRAAQLSSTMSLKEAIAKSKLDILDKTPSEKFSERKYYQIPKELILPLPSYLSIQ